MRHGMPQLSILSAMLGAILPALLHAGQPADIMINRGSPSPNVKGGFGTWLGVADNIDGAGMTGLIISAIGENPGGAPQNAGRVHVFDAATGTYVRTLQSANQEADGLFGTGVSGVPDTTGDGRGEIIVGAPFEDVVNVFIPISEGGRAYLFNGSTGARIRTIESPNKAIYGAFGASLAGVPDVNGDGLGDYAIGAPGEGTGLTDNRFGRVYLYNGSSGSVLRTLVSPNPGGGDFGVFGLSVAGLSDVTGDGRGDVLAGAVLEDGGGFTDGGRAYLINGSTGAFVTTFTSPNAQAQGVFGSGVGAIPDATGDGVNDLAIGAPGETTGGITGSGRAYIYNGATQALLHTLTSPNPEENGAFGFPVRGIADVNGNGTGDVIVGALGELRIIDETTSGTQGRCYIFDGSTGSLLAEFTSPNAQMGGRFGSAVGLPDLNADGRGDFAVSGVGEQVGADPAEAGYAYIFKGIQTGGMPSPTPSPTPSGTACSGRIVGDFDCSGCTDITDFLTLLDYWQLEYEGVVVGIDDFLALLDNWQSGPGC